MIFKKFFKNLNLSLLFFIVSNFSMDDSGDSGSDPGTGSNPKGPSSDLVSEQKKADTMISDAEKASTSLQKTQLESLKAKVDSATTVQQVKDYEKQIADITKSDVKIDTKKKEEKKKKGKNKKNSKKK